MFQKAFYREGFSVTFGEKCDYLSLPPSDGVRVWRQSFFNGRATSHARVAGGLGALCRVGFVFFSRKGCYKVTIFRNSPKLLKLPKLPVLQTPQKSSSSSKNVIPTFLF
jgi:hypothetical protein